MEHRVVKIATIFMVIFTVITGASLYYLPTLHAMEVEQQDQYGTQNTGNVDNSDMEMLNYDTADPEQEMAQFSQQIRIQLPAGADESNVTIEDQYITQTIDIKIPGADEQYLYDYPILGKSNNINNLTYESENGEGIIEITLDEVAEVQSSFEDGYLYMDFLKTHDVYDKVVVIDAGHGGAAPGATIGGSYEKDIDLAIVLQLKQIFEENNNGTIGVYYTRTEDVNPTFEQRVELANKADADIFISVHNNSTVSGKMSGINGTAVMYDELKEDTGHGTRELAQICMDEVSGILGSRNRGLISGNEIYIIRNSQVPVALIEVGFMTNRTELDELNSADYQRQAAQGIYNAIMRAFQEGF